MASPSATNFVGINSLAINAKLAKRSLGRCIWQKMADLRRFFQTLQGLLRRIPSGELSLQPQARTQCSISLPLCYSGICRSKKIRHLKKRRTFESAERESAQKMADLRRFFQTLQGLLRRISSGELSLQPQARTQCSISLPLSGSGKSHSP